MNSHFPTGTATPFARAVAAEIRAAMAAQRITGRELALRAGFGSHNYLAIRLRDEKPFTLDDVDRIVAVLEDGDIETYDFIARASRNHEERYWEQLLPAGTQEGLSEEAPSLPAVAKKGRREGSGEEGSI